ncbi:MAG: hypothetical protein M3120_07415 [Pseudomonadota bacterium]|nr:hypothetical protein [Pseudomonadota bacterium]
MNKHSYQRLSVLHFLVLSLASSLALVFSPATIFAEGAKPISGNYTATYAMQKALPVPDAKGHVLMLV